MEKPVTSLLQKRDPKKSDNDYLFLFRHLKFPLASFPIQNLNIGFSAHTQ
jgi:hypothetical protein